MTFLVYKAITDQGVVRLRPADRAEKNYKLTQLLQHAWDEEKRPVNQGWDVSADKLIRIHSNGNESYQTRRLLNDFHPSSTERIGLVEFLHVYAFTWGDKHGNPTWVPFMLKGRDTFYKEDYDTLSAGDKERVLADLQEFDPNGSEFVEFLYANINKNGNWVWGRTGMTNAAFLHGEAREFFRTCF
jgi:hypothetical protein